MSNTALLDHRCATILFADDMVVLHADGTAGLQPKRQKIDLAYLPRACLDEQVGEDGAAIRQRALARWRQSLQNLADNAALDKELYHHLHVNVSARALYAFAAKEMVGYAIQSEPKPIPPAEWNAVLFHFMSRLFENGSPAFEQEMKQRLAAPDRSLITHIAAMMGRNLPALARNAQPTMRAEVTRELEALGVTPRLSGPDTIGAVFLERDAALCADELKQKARAALVPGALESALKSLHPQAGPSRAEQVDFSRRLTALPESTKPPLAVLLDVALHDTNLSIIFTDRSPAGVFPDYAGWSHAQGLYNSRRKAIAIPMHDKPPSTATYPDMFGRSFEGVFAPLNHAVVDLPVHHSAENAWREELWHAALDRLFDHHTLPAPRDDQETWKRLYQATIDDMRSDWCYEEACRQMGKMPREEAVKLLEEGAKNGSPPHGILNKFFAELPVALMERMHVQGMDACRADTPHLMSYFEEVIMPRAQAMQIEQQGADASPSEAQSSGAPGDAGTFDIRASQRGRPFL